MKTRYFDFLCAIIGEDHCYAYSKLLNELNEIEFYSLVPNDGDRCEDGKQLRENFIEKGQHALSLSFSKPCSVLEMLVGLSIRLEFETMSSRWEKTPAEWFWILIDNLGLSGYNDDNVHSSEDLEEIHMKVQSFVDRRYDSDGNGGLFPLKNPKKDQRRIEIWYQMSAYILENYPM